jgi:nitrate/nitrite-specific signal transduction histidine kinase
MRERAERIGARLKVWSRDEAGTEVEMSIPGNIAFPAAMHESKRRARTKA